MRSTCSVAIALVTLLVAGCSQLPNPNDLVTSKQEDRAAISYRLMKQATDSLDVKVGKRLMSDQARLAKIREYAEELLKSISSESVPDDAQWMYAGLLAETQRWPEAESALQKAVKSTSDEDRRVNDLLHLAQAQAHNGKYKEALASAKSSFSAKDEDTAPILLSVLYELAPVVQGHGQDKALADALDGAIACHLRTKVDPTSDEGKMFNLAARYHIKRAQSLSAQLRAGI